MRKFRRSPALLFASLVLPLVQLVILGNAFGGNIKNVTWAWSTWIGTESVDVLERVRAVGANARTFLPTDYDDEGAALADLRKGVLGGVLIIPQHYSRDLLEQHQPHLALITDNTDRSVAGAVGDQMSTLVASINAPQVPAARAAAGLLDVVEVYPYIDYIKYLLPGSVALAIFVTAMIGGGMLFIDDKSRGLHEGYMVTPITKWELILGFNLSGVIKAVLAGETVLVLGAVVARSPTFSSRCACWS
jgi:ABC-2 type transport system permease protein